MAFAEQTTLTIIDSLLKVDTKELHDQFRKTRPLFDMIEAKAGEKLAGGGEIRRPFRLYPNFSFAGVRGEAGDMARPGTGGYTHVTTPVYPLNATGKFGHIGQIKTEKQLQALASEAERVRKDTMEGFGLNLNLVLWGYGTGIAGRINGAPNLDTMVVTIDQELTAGAGGTFGTLHMRVGQYLQASSSATATQPDRTGVAQIVSVDSATQITVIGNISDWADNDYLTWEATLNNVSDGIFSANEGYKATYQGKDRTVGANNYFKSTRITSVGTGDVENAFVQGMLSIQKNIGGYPKVAFTSSSILLEIYKDSVVSDRRWTNPGGKQRYALGFQAISLNSPNGSVDLFVEPDMPGDITGGNEGMIVAIDPDDWNFWTVGGKNPDWYKGPDGSISHMIQGTYGIYVNMLWVFNFLCDIPKRQLFIEDINNT